MVAARPNRYSRIMPGAPVAPISSPFQFGASASVWYGRPRRPCNFHHQVRDRLHQFRTANFEDRGFRPGGASPFRAELAHAHRLQHADTDGSSVILRPKPGSAAASRRAS